MVDIAGERRRLSDVGLTHRLRSQWGAARSYTDDRAVTEPATRLFLHITVTNPENYSSHDAHARGVEAIGIARFPNVGISYNELLMPGGLLYEAQPLTRRGAHTVNDFERSTCTTSGCPGRGTSVTAPSWNLNFNARALALARNVDDPVIDADVRAAARWGAAVKLAGYVTRDARWHGHRCVSAKSCPGDKGWARLDDIADLTANYVRNGLPGTEWWQMPIPEQDLNAIARAVHERSVQSGSEILPLGLAVGRSTAYGKRIEEAIVGLPAAVADAVIARLPGSSADAALIRQIVAEELTKLQLTTIATSEPTPTP
jgi:N-acetylmuramoyl-L-alanine amidase